MFAVCFLILSFGLAGSERTHHAPHSKYIIDFRKVKFEIESSSSLHLWRWCKNDCEKCEMLVKFAAFPFSSAGCKKFHNISLFVEVI